MAGEMTQFNDNALQTEGARMEVLAIRERIAAVDNVMRGAMIQSVHFGTIPGCGKKPTLLKPGAEMLAMMFRLAPRVTAQIKELGNGHREYTVTCQMVHIPTGDVWAEGIGSCSTMESKYRWRGSEAEDTGKAVPKAYWDAKNAGDMGKAQQLLGGPGLIAKKVDAGYTIHRKGSGRVENPDIADTYNTCLKMGKKRAQVDATLSALGCSHLFTQDLEDFRPMDDNELNDLQNAQQRNQPPADATAQQATQAMTDAQQFASFESAMHDLIPEDRKEALEQFLQVRGVVSLDKVPKEHRQAFYRAFIAFLNG